MLFQRLLEASTVQIERHDTQNLANSSWASAMVLYRNSKYLDAVAVEAYKRRKEASPLHLAQLSFAFSRFKAPTERFEFVQAGRHWSSHSSGISAVAQNLSTHTVLHAQSSRSAHSMSHSLHCAHITGPVINSNLRNVNPTLQVAER